MLNVVHYLVHETLGSPGNSEIDAIINTGKASPSVEAIEDQSRVRDWSEEEVEAGNMSLLSIMDKVGN